MADVILAEEDPEKGHKVHGQYGEGDASPGGETCFAWVNLAQDSDGDLKKMMRSNKTQNV